MLRESKASASSPSPSLLCFSEEISPCLNLQYQVPQFVPFSSDIWYSCRFLPWNPLVFCLMAAHLSNRLLAGAGAHTRGLLDFQTSRCSLLLVDTYQHFGGCIARNWLDRSDIR